MFMRIVNTLNSVALIGFALDKNISMHRADSEYKLVKKCVKKLKKNNMTVSTAESVTGGMIGEWIVSIPGASDVYEEGFITYSDFAKIKNLLVYPETIESYGVVSKAVAKEMATGLYYETGSDYSIATTGVAGPGKDEDGNKPGTVYIAVASRQHVLVRKYNFKGDRNNVRRKASKAAFKMLDMMMKKQL